MRRTEMVSSFREGSWLGAYEQARAQSFVEERMFAKAVQRLQKNVSPGALSSVVCTADLVTRVQQGHGRCSTMNLGHDHSAGQGEHSFPLEDMTVDLDQLVEAEKPAKA